MLLKWWRQSSRNRNIETIYGVIVAQARSPAFYTEYGVPDTIDGRFELVVLHLFLFLRRIGAHDKDQRDVAQALFDRFCADLDGNLREMGVGDLTVPKRMKKMAEAFYGRSAAYEQAMESGDGETLSQTLARNVYGQEAAGDHAQALTHYVFQAAAALGGIDAGQLMIGRFAFPASDNNLIPAAGAATGR